MAASSGITWAGILVRFLVAMVLVFATYNPHRMSYFHWVRDNLQDDLPLKLFAGVVLLIGWTIFIRAALRSLGAFGLLLSTAFFGTLIWLILDYGLVRADNEKTIIYIAMLILCGVLATGMSWSHIRRRLSGQLDTDDVEDG